MEMILPGGVLITMCGVVGLMIAGCSGAKVTSKALVPLDKYAVHNVAVIPFEAISAPQTWNVNSPSFSVPAGVKRSDISVAVPPGTDVPPRLAGRVRSSATDTVTDLMWSKLNMRPGLEVLSPEQARKVLPDLRLERPEQSAEEVASKIATRLGADAALTGKVDVYQERVGSRLGANPPAAVGFEVRLISRDGTVLWEGNYYERQRPMTEDFLGFIQRRGVFVTADELAEYGAEHLANEFPFGGSASE